MESQIEHSALWVFKFLNLFRKKNNNFYLIYLDM